MIVILYVNMLGASRLKPYGSGCVFRLGLSYAFMVYLSIIVVCRYS